MKEARSLHCVPALNGGADAQVVRVECLLCVSLALCAAEGGAVSLSRHFLVLINPISGKGRAEATFTDHVQPLFDIAEITCDVIVTST